jgi:Cof subfamily protein (haloacid dehalogenase superfamily)
MQSEIRLVIADVDGTLVNNEKELTSRSVTAVRRLHDAGIYFSITSGRPPRGLKMIIDCLALTDPIAAFNGGSIVQPDLTVIRECFVPEQTAAKVINTVLQQALDVWVYTDNDWLVMDAEAPHVAREQSTVQFRPKIVSDFSAYLSRVVKIVGVSDDYDAVAAAESKVRRDCGNGVSATRSQPYYLDVTHPDANKGAVVKHLSEMLNIPPVQIATIGDGRNDVLMFKQSGVSVAMGNADSEVKQHARFVTSSNDNDGFAEAIESHVLNAGDRVRTVS